MSRQEVISMVGRPPGDYAGGRSAPLKISPHAPRQWQREGYESWLYHDGQLFVRFDDAGTATDVEVCDIPNLEPPTLTERIRRWLGL
jgi:hypothetical protein